MHEERITAESCAQNLSRCTALQWKGITQGYSNAKGGRPKEGHQSFLPYL